MHFPFLPVETPDSDSEDGVILNIAIACEDLASALRAEGLFEQIKRGLGPAFKIQSSFWRFDEMEIPELRRRAEAEFATADMIVISYRADGLSSGLPAHLEGLLPQSGSQPRALVTLQGSNGNVARTHSSAQSAQYFREASAKAGIDFFSEEEWTTNERIPRMAASARFRA